MLSPLPPSRLQLVHGPPPLPVVELEPAALLSPKMATLLARVKAAGAKGAGEPAPLCF